MSIQEILAVIDQLPPEQRQEVRDALNRQQKSSAEARELAEFEPVPFERIKHLAGSYEGPGDLSTNPKYMQDFGKSSLS